MLMEYARYNSYEVGWENVSVSKMPLHKQEEGLRLPKNPGENK